MIPRLDIQFPLKRQRQFWFGKEYVPKDEEILLNHARSGIVLALQACLPKGGRVGVVAYNCHTVANAVVSAGSKPVFIDITNELTIDLSQPVLKNLDAIIVTNLFGIRNNIDDIRYVCGNAIIIVDNAHGYGLSPEGDFTVYSINQGKYPALGVGGILVVNNNNYKSLICQPQKTISILKQWKIYFSMMLKAFLYMPLVYGILTKRMKACRNNNANHNPVCVEKMCPGVSRIYRAWVEKHNFETCAKPFMDIVYTNNPDAIIKEYKRKGIEVDTHFKKCIIWAKEYGYIEGSCPTTECLIKKMVMIPNYFKS